MMRDKYSLCLFVTSPQSPSQMTLNMAKTGELIQAGVSVKEKKAGKLKVPIEVGDVIDEETFSKYFEYIRAEILNLGKSHGPHPMIWFFYCETDDCMVEVGDASYGKRMILAVHKGVRS